MDAVLLRTSSVPVHHPVLSGSPKVSLSRHDSITGAFLGERNAFSSPKISLHFKTNRSQARGIRRSLSENNIIQSESEVPRLFSKLRGAGSRSFPTKIPDVDDSGPLILKTNGVDDDDLNFAGIWTESGIPVEELGFSGDGFGKGLGGNGDNGNFDVGGGYGDKSKIGDYYREMLKSNPEDSLLLRNYGNFLYEVEKDAEKAEEYYGRSILASPGDGEVLSLYGKLIWETQRDESRAKAYFDQAIYVSPNDCMVLGSYAHFMWEADEDEDNEEIAYQVGASPAMVSAF